MELTVQKFHPALRLGQRMTLVHSSRPAFAWQGTFDSGCCIYAGAMAMAMLGKLSDPLRVASRRGREAEYWKQAKRFLTTGVSLTDFTALIHELRWGLYGTLFEAGHAKVVEFCQREVLRGRPVILTLRALSRSYLHAVLAVGVEGRQIGRTFEPHTLLLIDSAEYEPGFAPCNARLTYTGKELGTRAANAIYEAASTRRTVVVTGAVSLRMIAGVKSHAWKPR